MTEHPLGDAEVRDVLTHLIGLPVWAPSVGVGSFLTANFGSERRDSTGHRVGEFHLWVYGGAWKVLRDSRQITDSLQERDSMVLGSRLLEAVEISAVDFDRTTTRLRIQFSGNVELIVDPSHLSDLEDWLLYLPDGTVISVGPDGKIATESASASHSVRERPDHTQLP